MKAEVVSMTADNLDMEAIRRGGDILKQGGLVAFPTETVYGLGRDALIRRFYENLCGEGQTFG